MKRWWVEIISETRNVSKYYVFLVICLLLISTSANLVLAIQLNRANRKIAFITSTAYVTGPSSVTELEAVTLDGEETRISFSSDSRPTVLYVFSPTCVWCEKNLENIRVLTTQKSEDFRFIGVAKQ